MVIVATLNFQTSLNHTKTQNLFTTLMQNQVDIIALQEINTADLKPIPKDFSCYVNFKPGDLCTAFIYKKSLNLKEGSRSPDGRIITLILNDSIEIINFYGYPKGRGEELRDNLIYNELPKYIPTNRDIILLGDFNFVYRAEDRLKPGKIHADFLQLTNGLNLVDVHLLKDRKEKFTFHNVHGSTRIDRTYWRGDLSKIKDFKYLDVPFSDHVMIIVEISTEENSLKVRDKSKTPWKLNSLLLKDENFKVEVKNFIGRSKLRIQNYKNLLNWWDVDFKLGFKKLAIEFAFEKNQQREAHQTFLTRVLEQIRIKLEKGEETFENYNKVKSSLNLITVDNLESAKARVKLKYPINNEVANVAHLIADVKKREETRINQLQDAKGRKLSGQVEIQQIVEKFYRELYTLEERPGNFDYFLNNISKTVDNKFIEKLEKPLTGGEIFSALKSLPEGRSPGIDGIPTEFYVEFWDDLNLTMLDLFNYILQERSLTKTQKKGLITLLPKKGDTSLIENWRPVSVLCADYKLLSKVIVNRIKPALQSVINVNQTGALAGRTLTENLQYARNVIQNREDTNGAGAIIGLDFQKAFDRVDREHIYRILKKFNFPSNIIEYIKVLYEDSSSIFKVNNQLTHSIHLTRGIKQGCPLAALLYIVYIEPFALTLQKELRGIRIGSALFKTSCYIDDIHMFVSDEHEITSVAETIERYHQCTNSLINLSKTKILGLGKWAQKTRWPVQWIQTVKIMEILGIHFTSNLEKTIRLNGKIAITKVQKCITTGRTQKLTIHQRVVFANTFVVSKITHVAKILPIPAKTITKIQQAINRFTWVNRLEKLPFNQIINHTSKGGLGLVAIKEKVESLMISNFHKTITDPIENPNKLALTYWSSYDLKALTRDYKGPRAEKSHPLFQMPIMKVKSLLVRKNFDNFSSKCMYVDLFQSIQEVPKIICKNPMKNYQIILSNLNNPIIEPKAREFMFCYTHNILTTKDRLNRCKVKVSRTCFYCTADETAQHITRCKAFEPAITWLLEKLTRIDQSTFNICTEDLLTLNFNLKSLNNHYSCLWLVAEFMSEMWAVRQEQKQAAEVKRKILYKLLIRLKDFKTKANYKLCNNISSLFSG